MMTENIIKKQFNFIVMILTYIYTGLNSMIIYQKNKPDIINYFKSIHIFYKGSISSHF